ncbi:MAG: DUF4878 domain-containing protein [Treponema sp.]|jgi:hypothetical protein|nr:DUF4878 domain-containing protein [Treponema sp.]
MAKKGFWLGIPVMVLVFGLMLACSGASSPSDAVKQFYAACEKGDANAAAELMTADAAPWASMFMSQLAGQIAETGGIVETSEVINGETAVVTITLKDGSTNDFDLVKVDGKWKITLNKG